MNCEPIRPLDFLNAAHVQSKGQPIDIANLKTNEDGDDNTAVIETVVELEDAIKNGKNAVPIDLEKTLEQEAKLQQPKDNTPSLPKITSSPAKNIEVPKKEKQQRKISAKTIDQKADGNSTTEKNPKPLSPKSTVEKLPDIFLMQGPLVTRKVDTGYLTSASSEQSMHSKGDKAGPSGLCRRESSTITLSDELAKLTKDVDEVIAGLSPDIETAPNTPVENHAPHSRQCCDSGVKEGTPRPRKVSKKKKERAKKGLHPSECAAGKQQAVDKCENEVDKNELANNKKHRKTTKTHKQKQKETSIALTPIVIDKSPPRLKELPNSDESNSEGEKCVKEVSEKMLKYHWRPNVFPFRATASNLPPVQEEDETDIEQQERLKEHIKHRYAHVELAEANRSTTEEVIKPLDHLKKLPSIAPRCASPKVFQEDTELVTPRKMYKPLPPWHAKDCEQGSNTSVTPRCANPKVIHEDSQVLTPRKMYKPLPPKYVEDRRNASTPVITPRELYGKPVPSRKPVDLNGVLPMPKPVPPTQPKDENTARLRTGQYRQVKRDFTSDCQVPAPPEQGRDAEVHAARPRRLYKEASHELGDVPVPAPPSQPREGRRNARPAGMYKTAVQHDLHAPSGMGTVDGRTNFVPVLPPRPLSPVRPRRVARTVNTETAVTSRLFHYETSDEEGME